MIHVEIVDNLSDPRLSSWNKLLAKAGNPLPFQSYEWVKCWWDNFAPGSARLFVIIARENGDIIGIAPLMCRKYFHGRCADLKFIGTGYFDYFDFLIDKGREDEVLSGFLTCLRGKFKNFVLQLNNIFEQSAALKVFLNPADGVLSGFNILAQVEDEVPYLALPPSKDVFSALLKDSLKSDIARQKKRLGILGSLEFRACGDVAEGMEALEDYFSLHIKKWEHSGGYSVYKLPARRDFLRSLLKNLSEGLSGVYHLSLDGRKLAVCVAFKSSGRFIYYAPAYDPEFSRYSPGKVLLSRLIDYAIENKFSEFDFGIGKEPYKMDWPVRTRKLYDVFLFPDGKNIFNIFWRIRIFIRNKYFFNLLPVLRRLKAAVYLWRRINRLKGGYKRFK